MDRRAFISGMTLGLLATPLAADTQPARVYRIGYLTVDNRAVTPHHPEAFRQELRDLGYVEGRSPPLGPNWLRSRLMSSWPPARSPPWLPSK